jgi:hypothetical protein
MGVNQEDLEVMAKWLAPRLITALEEYDDEEDEEAIAKNLGYFFGQLIQELEEGYPSCMDLTEQRQKIVISMIDDIC